MAYDDEFVTKVRDFFNFKGTNEDFIKSGRYNYQLNCNSRGENCFNILSKYTQIDYSEKNIIDIGSGFGGTINAFANHGAYATGIEFNKNIFKFSLMNCETNIKKGNASILNGDASSKKFISTINTKFNLILLEDVFEHIYEIYDLVFNIKNLSKKDSILYFNIPNRYNPDYILLEAHKKLFGLTLLPPDNWLKEKLNTGFSIFYRPFELIELILNKFDIKVIKKIFLNNNGYEWLKDKILEIDDKLKFSTNYELYFPLIEEYKYNVEQDYENMNHEEFRWKYCNPSWRCICKVN